MGKDWLISSPRTFLALGQKECFLYNSGLDFKKKINIQEYSEAQKGKEIEKASSESVLKCLYLLKI